MLIKALMIQINLDAISSRKRFTEMAITLVKDALFIIRVTVICHVYKISALLVKFKEWEDSAKIVETATLCHLMVNHVTKFKI